MSDHSLQAPTPEHLAQLLPQYGIEYFIAQGGMGAVYKGRQLSLDRDVAIKVLLYEFGDDAEFRESFTTEAKAMARLNHPNLLGVLDYGDIEGMPYIVMEYVHGESLHEAAWEQAIDPLQAVTIVKGICEGLAHAHEQNIVHRDIKPSNILLTLNAVPKVADFGLAHAVDSEESGPVMGTPGYTAPEVFQDPSQAGQLADIYSVGVILHQLLTGIDPAGSVGPPTHPTGRIRLDAIWRKATHIAPSQRYQSVGAMATDLEKWTVAQQKAPVAGTAAPYNPTFRSLQTPTKTSSNGGFLVKLFVIAILGAVVVFTYQLLQENKEDIKKGIAGSDTVDNPEPTATPGKPPQPIPQTPEQVDITPVPDIEIGVRENPVNPPVVEPEPEPEPVADEDLPPGDPELYERAISLILEARTKRDKELAENAGALLFQLRAHSRDAEPAGALLIERLKGDVISNRIPITEGITGLPADISRDFELCLAKEESIDENHRSDLTRIRDAYLTRLDGAAADADNDELKRQLVAQAEHAKDLATWVELLSPEPEIEKKRSSGSFGAGGFPGKWVSHTPDSESQWIAHPDGRMEIVGRDWIATWKILEDGTLEVDWGKKKPHSYTRDKNGIGWTGKTGFGHPASLTPGDW